MRRNVVSPDVRGIGIGHEETIMKFRKAVIAAVMLGCGWITQDLRAQGDPASALAAIPEGEPLARLYDLRDVGALLAESGGNDLESLVMNVASAIGAELRGELIGGVYLIECDERTHFKFAHHMNTVRELHSERYEVEVAFYSATPEDSPRIGQQMGESGSPPAPDFSAKLVATRRVPTELRAMREEAYIARWQPVVSDSAVGYEAQIDRAPEGVEMQVTVGAGPEDDGGTTIRIEGEIVRSEITKEAGPSSVGVGNMAGTSLMIGLPRTQERSVRAEMKVAFDRPIVVAVTMGFRERDMIVMAVRVRKLEHGAAQRLKKQSEEPTR